MLNDIKYLFTNYRGLLAGGFLLIFFSGFGQSVFFGAYLPSIQESLGLSKTSIGTVYAMATIASSILIIFSGKGLDVLHLRHFVALVMLGMAAGCLIMAHSYNIIMLFFGFMMMRQFGQGLSVLSAQTSINRYVDKNRGKAVSIISLGGSVMLAVFPLIAIGLSHYIEWRTAWQFYALFIAVVLMPSFWLFLKRHQSTTHAEWEARRKAEAEAKAAANNDVDTLTALEDDWTRKHVIGDWRFYGLLSITFLAPFIGTAIAFYQRDIAADIGISPLAFASSFSFLTVASLASTLTAGYVLDKFGERPVLIAFCLFYTLGLGLLTSGMSLTIALCGMFFIGMGNGIIGVVGGPLLVQLYGTKHLGSIKSLLFASSILSSALSPFMMGYLQDQGIDILTQLSWFMYYTGLIWLITIPLCRPRDRAAALAKKR